MLQILPSGQNDNKYGQILPSGQNDELKRQFRQVNVAPA